MATIQIENQARNQQTDPVMLEKVAQRILSVLACPDAELSILLVDDELIREINRDYLQRDRPTNVISFAMREGDGPENSADLLGDVVISTETAARDAVEAGIGYRDELYFLLLHGILHLVGYDHERSGEEEARRMEEREQEIFALIKAEFLPT
ncbi:rRNA maturation RNase YbeY [Geothermobacter hydrogeniphilus]|uniref:Endoribonuclease YbeY n=1 Tax=Geothermobacter hydrogeniphilus TaxID=1969733 RepID=A0A2K2HC76_9BACT|nr:rRNA maturation RNase YbeY [Geothermobacter hydrogeniphilus]